MTTRTIPIRPRCWPLLLLTCSLASRAHADSAPPDGMEVLLFREQALIKRTRALACRPPPIATASAPRAAARPWRACA
jgi:hypothetical protein